jgi:hypothetical protein
VSILDFGSKGNGTTDDDAPLFNAAIASGAKYIVVPYHATRYLLLSPINMTTGSTLTVPPARACGITLEFQTSLDVNNSPNGTQPVLAKHTGHVLDMSGSRDCTIIGMNVEGDATTSPSTMIFSARNSAGSDCGRHRLYNIRSQGRFTTAPVYMYGTEETWFFAPYLVNAMPGKSAVYITGNNTAALSSTFITIIATANQSTSLNKFIGGQYHSQGNSGSTNEAVFFLEAVGDVTISDCFLYCPYGIALFYVSTVNNTSDNVFISGCRGEIGSDLPTYGLYFDNAASRGHANWAIEKSYLNTDSFVVYLADNQTITNFRYANITANSGFAVGFKNLEDSYIDHNASAVTGRAAGTVRRNVFSGYAGNRTLSGTNTFNLFENTDTGVYEASVGYKFPATQVPSADVNTLDDYEEGTWTPVFTCGTPGNLAVTYATRLGTYTKIGRLVTCQMSLALIPFTHTTASGIVSITGLPFTPAAGTVMSPGGVFGGFTSAGFTSLGIQFTGTPIGYIVKSGSGQPFTNCPITDFPSGGQVDLYFTFSYFV